MRRPLLVLVTCASLAVPSGHLTDMPRGSLVVDLDGVGSTATDDGRTRGDAPAEGANEAVDEGGAVQSVLPLTLPYAEQLVFRGAVDDPGSVRFEVRLTPPAVLHLVTQAGEGARGGLIVDILQRRGALGWARLAVFGATEQRSGTSRDLADGATPVDVRWTPPVHGDYVVRVRPVRKTIGAFAIAVRTRAPLDFPVATDRADAVRSFFGDARDGGARDHHGIDIFASRGTPVLAAADGFVARVGTSARGGLHVWQRAESDAGERIGSLYYAHLDSVAVVAGTRVARGERLGTVGNTGNARTTPPHLHFGLYRRYRGPEDPLPLVGRVRTEALALEPGHGLPPWLAVASPVLNVRSGPGTAFDVVERLEGGSLVQVLGVNGRWVRVRARTVEEAGAVDDVEGFVSRALLGASLAAPFPLARDGVLLAEPDNTAPRLGVLAAGAVLIDEGVHGRHRRVTTPDGARGWLALPATAATTNE